MERCITKNYLPVRLLFVVIEIFEKVVYNGLVDHIKKCDLFLISSVVLGLLDQLHIFWQMYLIELLGFLLGLGLLKHSVHAPPPPPLSVGGMGRAVGLSLLPDFQKGGLGRISIFKRGLLGKRGWTFSGDEVAVFT